MRVLYTLNITVVLIVLVSLPFLDPDSGAAVAAVMTLVVSTITFLGIIYVQRSERLRLPSFLK